jgi:hypothetical protein
VRNTAPIFLIKENKRKHRNKTTARQKKSKLMLYKSSLEKELEKTRRSLNFLLLPAHRKRIAMQLNEKKPGQLDCSDETMMHISNDKRRPQAERARWIQPA